MTIRFYQQSQLTEWVSFYLLMIRWWSQLTKSIYSNKINTVEKLQFIFISLENCRNYYYYLLYYYRRGLLFITIYYYIYIICFDYIPFLGGESFISRGSWKLVQVGLDGSCLYRGHLATIPWREIPVGCHLASRGIWGIPKNMGLTWLNMAYNHATNHDKLELNMVLEENLRAWWSRSC